MSDYYEGGRPERSRRVRAGATLAITVLVLFFAFWYALSYYRADRAAPPGGDSTSATCRYTAPRNITVNVFNGTQRNGLAGSVARELRTRGFTVAEVTNSPTPLTKGVAEVRSGKAGARRSLTLIRHVGNPERVRDSRQDKTVDLVLGPDFTELVKLASVPACARD
ncbi:LytR C-terminal domain-containing protein [Janibacter sp. G1551]|uniref:LytR C-terminal domain-containing protein n=1 Tax=Janibacter sp. G1551 TaxID=3420440 RepID=UPI003CFFADEA